jgi:hypothetical protein
VLGDVQLLGEPAVLLKRLGELGGEPPGGVGTPTPLSESVLASVLMPGILPGAPDGIDTFLSTNVTVQAVSDTENP